MNNKQVLKISVCNFKSFILGIIFKNNFDWVKYRYYFANDRFLNNINSEIVTQYSFWEEFSNMNLEKIRIKLKKYFEDLDEQLFNSQFRKSKNYIQKALLSVLLLPFMVVYHFVVEDIYLKCWSETRKYLFIRQ